MQCYCGINSRRPRWTLKKPWTPKMKPGTHEETGVSCRYNIRILKQEDIYMIQSMTKAPTPKKFKNAK